MMTLLAVPFALVAAWLVYEALWQAGAPFRFRVLALAGFILVVAGVYVHQVPVIVVGLIGFVVGEGVATLYTRGRDHAGWTAPMPGRVASRKKGRRRRGGATASRSYGQVGQPELADEAIPRAASASPDAATGEFGAVGLGTGLGAEWGADAESTFAGSPPPGGSFPGGISPDGVGDLSGALGASSDDTFAFGGGDGLTGAFAYDRPGATGAFAYGGADAGSPTGVSAFGEEGAEGDQTRAFAYDDAGAGGRTGAFAYGDGAAASEHHGPSERSGAFASDEGAPTGLIPPQPSSPAEPSYSAEPAYSAEPSYTAEPAYKDSASTSQAYAGYGADPDDPLFGAYNPAPVYDSAPAYRQAPAYADARSGQGPGASSYVYDDSYLTADRPDPLLADPHHPAGYSPLPEAGGGFSTDAYAAGSYSQDAYGGYGAPSYADGLTGGYSAPGYPHGAEPYGTGGYGTGGYGTGGYGTGGYAESYGADQFGADQFGVDPYGTGAYGSSDSSQAGGAGGYGYGGGQAGYGPDGASGAGSGRPDELGHHRGGHADEREAASRMGRPADEEQPWHR